MCPTKILGYVLCAVIFSAFPISGETENDVESISTRLTAVERIVSKQAQVIVDQESRLANQERVIANQETHNANYETLITNQETRLANQERVIANQETRLATQEREIANQETCHANQENLMRNQETRLANQERVIANQETRHTTQEKLITNQETRLANQERVIVNHETRLVTQERVIANQETHLVNQERVIATQARLISNLMTHLNMGKNNTEKSSKEIYSTILEDPSLDERVQYLEELAKIKVLRTCAELEQHGVKTSGFYHLDPDGEMIGNAPIKAFCDFENHVTEVLHNADDELINISHCDSNLCYTREFVYTAHMDQITSLMQLSTFCDQTIEFNCFMAPLKYGDVQLGVWTDRHGEDQIYFDGSNYDNHVCSCDSFSNCTGQETLHNKCNCDNIVVPDWMQDAWTLNNMTALPVMKFKYGPLTYDTQQARLKVGRLRCGGIREVSSIPHTCRDLKLLGEMKPGLYHLQDAEHGDNPKMSFCQMDQPGYGEGMETQSHWVKLSSGPGQVFFAVKHNGENDIVNGAVVTFDQTVANEGAGMDSSTGVFTAPVAGLYDFKLSGLTYGGNGGTRIYIYLNGVFQLGMYDSNVNGHNSMSRAWAFPLNPGDEVKLVKKGGGFAGYWDGLVFIGILM